MTSPLTDQQLNEIDARANALNDLGLPGGTWQASPRDEKSVVPPEMAHVVEDVLRTKAALLRSSVGVFGDEAHAEFVGHAPADIAALLVEVRRLRTQLAAVHGLCDEQDQVARMLEFPTPPWIRAVRAVVQSADVDEMAAALRRDGFGPDQIATMLPAAAAVVSSAAESEGAQR